MDENERDFINANSTGFVQEGEVPDEEEEVKPEDTIPDLPENKAARDFLKTAPTKGLFMPLGKEVKVMQCWRCKAYGHRTGDRECPMRESGNKRIETIRQTIEDPMSLFVESKQQARIEKYARVEHLKALMEDIRAEENLRKQRKLAEKQSRKRERESSNSRSRKKKKKKNKKDTR